MIFRVVSLLVLIGGTLAASMPRTASAAARPDTHILQTASARLAHDSRAATLLWLRRQAAVSWARLGIDGRTVDIQFRDGRRMAILPATMTTTRLTGSFRPDMGSRAPLRAPAGRALVLEPFATELGLGSAAGTPEVNVLQSAGFTVDQLYDTNVTVAKMALLSQYNVTYMHTHSGENSAGEGVVATGEPANTNDPSVAPLVQNGSVITVSVSGSAQAYYAITSTYIRKYEGQFPHDSLVFFNGCALLGATLFWGALQSKGVGVMVTWDKEATSRDNYLGAAAFFNEMKTGLSVSSALQAEKAAGFGTSAVNNTTANLGYEGDATITLARAAAGQPAPAGSSATPTPSLPLPTATPRPASPTATPIVKPPLTASLKPRVRPGTLQSITIHSSPNTLVHVVVTFPDGKQRAVAVTTDGSGLATFAFLQQPSRIVFGHLFAHVTLSAGIGTATSTVTQRYRIGWGKVDVSVSPRSPRIGGAVSIDVHSWANVPVIARLRFPLGTATLHGTTARTGWARLTYRLRARHFTTLRRTVHVRATVVHNGRRPHATTTFAVHA